MPRPRVPTAKAKVSGQENKNPQRFKTRKDAPSMPLGGPSIWLSKDEKAVWLQFTHEIPWLMESHRCLLEIAVRIRTRLMQGQDVGIQAINLLRQCLSQMGATPVDASKIVVSDEQEDPDAHFFN